MKKYEPKEIEPKWQKYWEENGTFRAVEDPTKQKFYGLIEFPYPSGAGLHVGHPRPFTAIDVISRKKRMEGCSVLFPIGFDAFGLPTENYAIKTGRAPKDVTAENIATFTRQLTSLGFGFDWSRVIDTTDPTYYRWTQWIFLQLFKHGLAYKKNQPINWCPKDKIGLANEEVVDGCCERCGGPVEKRNKEQWMLAITKYADSLLEGLNDVDYIERARVQQENWIGRSEGAEIDFAVSGSGEKITVFTTRPDTIFGATYMVLAPEHPIVQNLKSQISNFSVVEEYIERAKRKTDMERSALDKEKTGVELKGVKAVNPASGEEIPVWMADYVLGNYGTGAIMAVPAHDERDREFANTFHLPVKTVVINTWNDAYSEGEVMYDSIVNIPPYVAEGWLVNSGEFTGQKSDAVRKQMAEKYGKATVQYKLRDWVFSRQRYWGEPIPLVYCAHCAEQKTFASKGEEVNPGWIPLPESELPLKLPEVEKYQPTDTGESPLAAMTDWVKTTCPRCGGDARRETDTMPNWAGSSWYFLRYADPHNDKELASQEALKYWMSVDWYNGGMEHTVLHLLYSRFWNQFLYDIGVVPVREPYKKRTSHGMILAKGGEKMSKSKGNVVNPDEMVDQFGADALRTYIMFMGPFDQAVEWDTNGLVGVKRFLDRVWGVYTEQYTITSQETLKQLQSLLHKTIKKVTEDIDTMRFNTAVSTLMIMANALLDAKKESVQNTSTEDSHFEPNTGTSATGAEELNSIRKDFLKLLSPFAPHMAEELWRECFKEKESITQAAWPVYEEKFLIADTMTIAVQVNGKLRDTIVVSSESLEDDIKKQACSTEKVAKHLNGQEPKKVIYVKGKLVSIVM